MLNEIAIAGPILGFGGSPANKSTPSRPKMSEPTQNPGFTLPNAKPSHQIPGLGLLALGSENTNSVLRPEAPPFEPSRIGERNHGGPFEPPQPRRVARPDSFREETGRRPELGRRGDPTETGRRPLDVPEGDHPLFAPGRNRGDFESRRPGRDPWNEPRGPPGDFKHPNWREPSSNNFERRDRDLRSNDRGPPGPNFRGPPGERLFGPPADRLGILGSPPRNADADSRPGLLGPPPGQAPQQSVGSGPQGPPNARPSLLGAPPGGEFPHQVTDCLAHCDDYCCD